MNQGDDNRSCLSRIIPWSHELLAEVVSPGDLAVDLTAGRGQDTLALWQMVGDQGQVLAFDIQKGALMQTQQRLQAAGARVRMLDQGGMPAMAQSGVDLIACCHSRYAEVSAGTPTAIIANLGYLPGGNQQLITQPETTLMALQQALVSLAHGGRMAVVVYPGHAGGAAEAALVTHFFTDLGSNSYDVLHLSLSNRKQAPALFIAEKRIKSRSGSC